MVDLAERVVDLALSIQQIPAPTFAESERAAFIRREFQAEGLVDVGQDEIGNVYGRLPGAGQARPLVVSAHIDTVFPPSTDLSHRREPDRIFGPGIGDNSLGVAGLFGVLWALRGRGHPEQATAPAATDLPGDIWLVANVGEEGLGDLRGMRSVVTRFGNSPLAYLVLEGMALGQVYHRALGVRRYRITCRTAGGHSWVDYGRPSAIHELAGLITRLTGASLANQPRTTLNVGVIAGGTTVNTIAAEAHLELDLRSESARSLENLAEWVEQLVRGASYQDVKFSAEIIGQRPAGKIPASHPLVQLAKHTLEGLGFQPNLGIGSTDANIPLSYNLPAICLGLSTGGGAHTANEYVHTRPIAQGLEQLVQVVDKIFTVLR